MKDKPEEVDGPLFDDSELGSNHPPRLSFEGITLPGKFWFLKLRLRAWLREQGLRTVGIVAVLGAIIAIVVLIVWNFVLYSGGLGY